uniref:Acyl-CoA-binding domain-containing protein 6 n=1 Tax=Oryctolagus cuniculus TaxID=9986 RepID=A0A5F9CNJ5_RABIT
MASPPLPSGATTGDSGGELSSGDDSGGAESPQSPEPLAELFEKAAAHLQGLLPVASREQLLYLYARYKQVKVGNCNTPKPSFFDFEGKQKWEAWKALGDSSPSQAMQEYIAVVKKLDPGWNPQIPEKKGKEANTGFGGPVVSSLYHEETIREEDKNIFDYCRENNIDHITKAIKSKSVDVNMKDEEGRALLHWACDRGHKELVTVFLQYKADVNCQDNEGQTALHYGMMLSAWWLLSVLYSSLWHQCCRQKPHLQGSPRKAETPVAVLLHGHQCLLHSREAARGTGSPPGLLACTLSRVLPASHTAHSALQENYFVGVNKQSLPGSQH